MKITRIGIDLGKSTFHVCATDRSGKVVIEKVFTRRALRQFMAGLERCLVGLSRRAGVPTTGGGCCAAWGTMRG